MWIRDAGRVFHTRSRGRSTARHRTPRRPRRGSSQAINWPAFRRAAGGRVVAGPPPRRPVSCPPPSVLATTGGRWPTWSCRVLIPRAGEREGEGGGKKRGRLATARLRVTWPPPTHDLELEDGDDYQSYLGCAGLRVDGLTKWAEPKFTNPGPWTLGCEISCLLGPFGT